MFGLMLRSTHEAALKARDEANAAWVGQQPRILAKMMEERSCPAISSKVSAFLAAQGLEREISFAAIVAIVDEVVTKTYADGKEMADLWKKAIEDQVALAPLVKIGRARQAALQKAKDKKAAKAK